LILGIVKPKNLKKEDDMEINMEKAPYMKKKDRAKA